MSQLFEQDIEEELRMPWELICKLAVKARCLGLSMNDLANRAIAEYIASAPPETAKE